MKKKNLADGEDYAPLFSQLESLGKYGNAFENAYLMLENHQHIMNLENENTDEETYAGPCYFESSEQVRACYLDCLIESMDIYGGVISSEDDVNKLYDIAKRAGSNNMINAIKFITNLQPEK